MMKYSRSAILDFFDFIKRLIYIIEIFVQLLYIGYLTYRLAFNMGMLIVNIILLTISGLYFIYHIATTKEFYTYEQKRKKKTIKFFVKVIKRIVNAFVIGVSIYQLIFNPSNNDNLNMLMSFVMILGFVLSIIGDIIIGLINEKVKIIVNAIKYDLDNLIINHQKIVKVVNFFSNKFDLDINKIPLYVDKETVKRIELVNYRQEKKARRKFDFLNNV